MNARWSLAFLPLVAALAAGALLQALSGTPSSEQAHLVVGVLATAVAALGATVAARSFTRGDYLWRAWALTALAYVLLVLKRLAFGTQSNVAPQALSQGVALASGLLTVVANAASIAGVVLVARAWRVGGLSGAVSSTTRRAATALSVVVAVGLAGSFAWSALERLLGGDVAALGSLASSVGDIVGLALIAPIVLTAVALRGGTLSWPWSLRAVSSFGWVLYDAMQLTGHALDLTPEQLRPLETALRTFACVAILSSGLLQRMALAEPAPAPALDPAA